MTKAIDPTRTFVHLAKNGDAVQVELTPTFLRDSSASALYDRLIGAFEFASNEDLHSSMQEMHPEADEVLFLVEGAIDLVLQEPGGERTVSLGAGEAFIVPRGIWHRLVMREPGKLLFINSRTGMESRDA